MRRKSLTSDEIAADKMVMAAALTLLLISAVSIIALMSTDDDLLLAYISQKILIAIEDSDGREGLHFDEIIQLLESPGINSEDIDEALSWLLQNKEIIEVERDVFVVDG